VTITICYKCSNYGLRFERKYAPEDLLWGKRSSPIWVVGLNPKERPGYSTWTRVELERYFDTEEKNRSYFRDFEKVSQKLFEMLGEDNGVAHTDIVKCFSDEFPPRGHKGEVREIIDNCRPFFEKQLKETRPRLIICNGRPVCEVIKEIIKPNEIDETSYHGAYNGIGITVILSGFIGRIDNYAKRRLGSEIEQYIKELGIG
jgi:hypothetical protein